MSAAIRAIVRGRVQGVGFRWFVVREARRLGLRGYTRNLADGTVEVLAAGDATALEELLAELRRGPPGSRVDRVDREEAAAPPPDETDFDIRA